MIGIFPAYDEDQNFIGWEVWCDGRVMHGPCSIEEAGAFVLKFQFLQQFCVEPRWQEDKLLATEIRDGKSIEFDNIDEAATHFGYEEPQVHFKPRASGRDHVF